MTRPRIASGLSETPDGMTGPTTPVEAAGAAHRGQQAASCSGCSARWTGSGRAHCGSCHATFGGVGLFDLHRDQKGPHGACLDPERVTTFAGERVMFLRGGIWRAPEMTDEQKARAFGGMS